MCVDTSLPVSCLSLIESIADDFCEVFDLTKQVPPSTILNAIESGKLSSIDVPDANNVFEAVIEKIRMVVREGGFK